MSSHKKKKLDSTEEDDRPYTIKVGHPDENVDARYPEEKNKIKTSRYTPLTFLPKNLYEQFRRVANIYFSIIMVMQLLPGVSPINPVSTIFPLLLVLTVTAVKEGIEDFHRGKSDNHVNHLPAKVMRKGVWAVVTWEEVVVGDIVKVKKGEAFPADLVLLSSSENKGVCYVETSSLDGETNLKMRESLKETCNLTKKTSIARFDATIEAESPSDLISVFQGALSISGAQQLPLTAKQILLRGCTLRNTDWCVGVAVYIGYQTKLMKNSMDTNAKLSTLERQMNKVLIFLFIFMAITIFTLTFISIIWTSTHEHTSWYLSFTSKSKWQSLLNVFTYSITFSMMIPISLYVTLEMVRVVQSKWINWDLEMYDESSDTPAKARTSNLTEELGRVKYIFTDKTGTLTRNQMELLQVGVGNEKYTIKGPDSQKLRSDIKKHEVDTPLDRFFTALAVCHTVVPEPIGLADETENEHENGHHEEHHQSRFHIHRPFKHKDKSPEEEKPSSHTKKTEREIHADGEHGFDFVYQAASPDEGALVEASRDVGYTFFGRTQNDMTISVLGEERVFELLNVLEFNSTRKRMSVVVKDTEGRIFLYCKGADSAILDRVKSDPETMRQFLEDFATDGLRTLCVARRELDSAFYDKWCQDYQRASASLQNREKAMDDLADKIETDFELLGVTGIEDKLQEGVPDAIAALRRAFINIWVLTGDKKETAVNIAYSTRLLDEEMELIELTATDDSIQDEISAALSTVQKNASHQSTGVGVELGNSKQAECSKFALVIQGLTITQVLKDSVSPRFLELSKFCTSVVCVRATPLQKAELVKLVRDNTSDITLAIGDGANDVSMIRAAHVGVGISGVEGNQAVMASDYSIAQFRFLYRLLMIHGRWDYIRNCKVVKYSFYKSMAFALTQVLYAFYSGFSAQTLYDGWSIAIFNVLFTGLPVIFLGIFDQDVHRDMVFHQPYLYKTGQEGYNFSWRSLISWYLAALYHAAIIFFVVMLAYNSGVLERDGTTLGLTAFGVICYTLVIIVVNLRLAMEIHSWVTLTHIGMWGSIIAWFVWISLYSWFASVISSRESEMYWVGFKTMSTPMFWLLIVGVSVMCLLPNYTIRSVVHLYKPNDAQVVREQMRMAEDLMEQGDLQHLTETASLLPVRKETAALTKTLPKHVVLAKSLARAPGRRYTGFAFAGEEGDLNAMQARYGNLRSSISVAPNQ